ncbi:hypothetical protein WQE_39944 [Paraburkholderia hospita]|uniref:Uncharacterized protein n=1 Tax=Paraburkholderia hospita TaxID=169430 RepID=A0ABP2PCU0_9BURK|nr:hypothetical protein WQE_39944 [Paraburkholderia hospita]
MPRAFDRKANHIDHGIGMKFFYLLPKRTGCLSSFAIYFEVLDGFPCTICLVGVALAATDDDDLVASLDQPWNEIRADVPAATDNCYAHLSLSFFEGQATIPI